MRGLLQDDAEWERCLDEARMLRGGKHLRDLFTTICINENPSDAMALFSKFSDDMSDDIAYKLHLPRGHDLAKAAALLDIERALEQNNFDLQQFNIPPPSQVCSSSTDCRTTR